MDAVAIHFGASTLFSIAWVGLRLTVDRLLTLSYTESFSFPQSFKDLLGRTFLFNLLVYWVIVTARHAVTNGRPGKTLGCLHPKQARGMKASRSKQSSEGEPVRRPGVGKGSDHDDRD